MPDHRALALTVGLVGLVVSMSGGPALADRPPGDNCGSPIPLQWGGDWGYAGDLYSYANDYNPAQPGPSCTGSPAPGRDAVFAMDMGCGMGLVAGLNPENFDGSLYIVTDCGDISGSCVVGCDNAGVGAGEQVFFTPTTYRTYYIVVDAHDFWAGGAFELSFEFLSVDGWEWACCFPDGHCEILESGPCEAAGGETLGPCSDCAPNPCGPTPSLEQNWGAIKARYR